MEMYKNTWIREDRYKNTDKKMVDDCRSFYGHFTLDENSVVMDLGANIGGFAVMCKGVRQYIAVEPDENNIEVLKKNLPPQGTIIQGVVSVSEKPTLTFFQNGSPQGACSGTVSPSSKATAPMANNNKIEFQVKNYQIDKLIEKYKPTHIKIDIEGSEIEWFKTNPNPFPDYVKEIAIEVHRKTGVQYVHDNDTFKDYQIISITPNTGFPNAKRYYDFPKYNIKGQGAVFGIDVFLRKNS